MYNGESRYNQGRGTYKQGRKMASPVSNSSGFGWGCLITVVCIVVTIAAYVIVLAR
jgi:hypothetical protein